MCVPITPELAAAIKRDEVRLIVFGRLLMHF
jgi:hypothetical protein